MPNVQVYYDEPYRQTLTARVTRLRRIGESGRCEVELDRTLFYPAGGGQPCDHGIITSATGSLTVKRVTADGRHTRPPRPAFAHTRSRCLLRVHDRLGASHDLH